MTMPSSAPRPTPLFAGILLLLLAGAAQAETIRVTDVASLGKAISQAEPGDEIVLADGTYEVGGKIRAAAEGERSKPIVVRAEHRWKAEIKSSGEIAFEVSGPYWEFRDLDIRGTCADDSTCEHAFHVVGDAVGVKIIGNRLVDFNSQVKVNAVDKRMPTGGLIEGNEVFNTHPRQTDNPVNSLNIDHGTDWVIRGNLIYDFEKAGGNGVSFGAYVKGGAERPVIERNLVICRWKMRDRGGARIGLSFGGGGITPALCSPTWSASVPCSHETIGGIMRNNIVANCSDVGIYLNNATDTKVLYNTLVRTQGIDVRFPGSSAELHGNLMASAIRGRDGGTFKESDNMTHALSSLFEDMFKDANAGDLHLKGSVAAIAGKGGQDPNVTDDFCGRKRKAPYDMGALQVSMGDCPTSH